MVHISVPTGVCDAKPREVEKPRLTGWLQWGE